MNTYKTSGTCSRKINFEINSDDILTFVEFEGGCRGNTQGVCRLCTGKNAHEVQRMLSGIQCQGGTSCPDQLSKAIAGYYARKNK